MTENPVLSVATSLSVTIYSDCVMLCDLYQMEVSQTLRISSTFFTQSTNLSV